MRNLILFFASVFVFMLVSSMTLPPKKQRIKPVPLKISKEVSSFSGEMLYIPSGSHTIHTYGEDHSLIEQKELSFQAFYISKTEVTNKQYRFFYREMVELVGKDSATFYIPDTTVFSKDIPNGDTNPMVKFYYSHKAYENYPVVGVSWLQAKGYVEWMNYKLEEMVKENPELRTKLGLQHFRIPTECEWEYAASGGKERMEYSWGSGLMNADKKGNIWGGNFGAIKDENGVLIKTEMDDAAFFIAVADSYEPNGFGIYNMSGNVNEWVCNTYEENKKNKEFYRDTSTKETLKTYLKYYDSSFDPVTDKKTIKGGGYLDGPIWCKTSYRRALAVDERRSDIGFRVCITYYPTEF